MNNMVNGNAQCTFKNHNLKSQYGITVPYATTALGSEKTEDRTPVVSVH